MAQRHMATVKPLPSSILHNGAEVRSQHTRAAAKMAVRFMSRKLRSFNRKAAEATPDIVQMQGGH
ncbi:MULTISPECIES: hypothetical protein [Marinobacter]|uniref:Uncharacterized protein n=1 Tax=Marinobacter xiaoshiensis TaxID=3073652 RepID=A0ABU2HDJ4_9GAMM|nr:MULTISPECIES: hypothetical protein [unclassified Marinobacter]MBK1873569.1 hypothetical protein [Marinobacter sp. 1-3A]MDS1309102.1 hypothetical protein [Marinobacter sp. F60267]